MIDPILVLLYASPLLLAAYGEIVVEKSGVINIGLEGTMLMGAFAGAMTALQSGNVWLGLAAGLIAGLILTLLTAWFSISLGADQVVVGTAATLLALGLSSTLFRAQFGQSGQLMSLPTVPKLGSVDLVMLLTILLAPVLTIALWRSRWGLALRACGEYPNAADSAGWSVPRLRYQAMALGGALGGLAGAYLSLGVAGSFVENMTGGRGFIAIAMVTFGRWRPWWVFAACLFMGTLEALQFVAQGRNVAIPHQLLLALPYAAALFVLFASGKGSKAPAALGLPYRGRR
jgi:ABC-type uncharacterized transport system permease subunit